MSKYESQLANERLALERNLQALDEISSAASEAEKQYLADWHRSDELLRQLDDQLLKQRQSHLPQKSRSLLGLSKSRTATAPLDTLLHFERQKLLDRMEHAAKVIEKSLSIAASIDHNRREISRLEASLAAESEKATQLAISRQRKQAREEATRARAAAHDDASRVLAAQLKKRMSRQNCCPYCGDVLGADVHADHIYPVSKGGLSTPGNLVFVCGPCNTRKRDMTLAAFIRAFELNREEIESRLSKLGKDF
jgi:5-methylcytosine-specific restriction endonuclease McrA